MDSKNLPLTSEPKLTRKDFLSAVDPRWCPGCGCYAVFKTLTGILPTLDIPKEKFAIISGIGCSSRFPYYASTYGFHTIHGRAPTVAMGLKLSRPDLSVWVMTGDGDGLSIGGNHFIHMMRRNPNIKVILFNNQIYGLTKGQASPTTQVGTKTKTTPAGVQDNPMRPVAMALAAGATFVARAHDSDNELLTEVLTAAANHQGIAFVEIMMNCVIFNDGAIDSITGKVNRAETTVRLRDGEPLVFGAQADKGIRLRNANPEVVALSDARKEELLVHDVHRPDSSLAFLLGQMSAPTPFGVFRQVNLPTADGIYPQQQEMDLDKLLRSGTTWTET
ncbi:MAG: 2-oxoacid:ferredoxin oxidoreductase subunit beta [Bdellovibrionales bacterium GWB1_55_8]|nr:MAG: 2-oxoacid:ferredoxin oxidoreductase subunit beta [Bdellovibrionales bacterium GWB1_55_8]